MDYDNLEISSDSENTIIVPLDENNDSKPISFNFESVDIGPIPSTSSTKLNVLPVERENLNKYSLSDFSDDDIAQEPLFERIKSKNSKSLEKVQSWQDNFNIGDFCEDSNDVFDLLNKEQEPIESSDQNKVDKIQILKEKYALRTENEPLVDSTNKDKIYENLFTKENDVEICEKFENFEMDTNSDTNQKVTRKKLQKSQEKIDKEMQKEAKKKERELKKIESEKQKAKAKAEKQIERSIKPEQLLKNIIVDIDSSILNTEYKDIIESSLKSESYNFRYTNHDISEVITWSRKVQSLDEDNFTILEEEQSEKHIFIILHLRNFLEHIQNKTFVPTFMSMHEPGKKLILPAVKLQSYYNYLEKGKKGKCKSASEFKDYPILDIDTIEEQIIELQVYSRCYFRMVSDYQEMADFLLECTKAVALIPHKDLKHKMYEDKNEYFDGENKNCVKVDSQGNGLTQLWTQMLTQFPLASLETSEAIVAVYPTMFSLFEAYENCASKEEGEKLLQDIPVRRAAGPLAGVRRIGPELSKKIYTVFTSTENVYV